MEVQSDGSYLEHELHERFRQSPELFDFLEQSSLDGVWFWDLENFDNEWMSPRFWQVFGVDPRTKKHKASEWQDLIHPDDLQTALENFQKHLEDPNHPYDQLVRYKHADGSMVTVRCRGLILRDDEGNPKRMLGAHNNITELVRAKEAIEAANQELARRLEQAEDLAAARSAFLSMVSHEVRTPLNAITGLLELISKNAGDERQKSRAEMGLLASRQLHSTLTNVLNASKIENGWLEEKRSNFASSVFEEILDTLCIGAQQRHAVDSVYCIDIAKHMPKCISLDLTLFTQVANNLIDNAMKFSDATRVDVQVDWLDDHDGTRVVLSVADGGPGIAQEDRARIFEAFQQTQVARIRSIAGTGLGLSIVKDIMELLGGSIELENTSTKGSTFRCVFPMSNKEALDAAQ